MGGIIQCVWLELQYRFDRPYKDAFAVDRDGAEAVIAQAE